MIELLDLGQDLLTLVIHQCTLLSLYRVKQTCKLLSACVVGPVAGRAGARARERLGWDACRMRHFGKPRYQHSAADGTAMAGPAEECHFYCPQQAQSLGNRLIVSDTRNNRIMVLTLRGEYRCHYQMPDVSPYGPSLYGLAVYDRLVYVLSLIHI